MLLLFIYLPLHADGEILKVAVTGFNPPYVIQGANRQLYGFDISMMQTVCKIINRSCQFQITLPGQLLRDVESKKADLALTMTITLERATLVNFSLPYLLSNSLLLGTKGMASKSFQISILDGRPIGVIEGTIFVDIINTIGIKNPKIIQFKDINSEIKAVHDGDIDAALLDAPSARYWQIETSNDLVVLGKPIVYGFGLGIAINKDKVDLLGQINKALLQYQNSEEYKQNYDRYMGHFQNEQ